MGSTGGSRSSSSTGGTTRVQYTDRNGNPIGNPVSYRQTERGVQRTSGIRRGRSQTGASNLREVRRKARNSGNRVSRG